MLGFWVVLDGISGNASSCASGLRELWFVVQSSLLFRFPLVVEYSVIPVVRLSCRQGFLPSC